MLIETWEAVVLPGLGALGGITALIVFLLSWRQRKAERERICAEAERAAAEAEQMIQLTPARLQQMITDSAEKLLATQGTLIESLQARLVQSESSYDGRILRLEARIAALEQELCDREDNIVALEERLAQYQAENQRYRIENQKLKTKIDQQQKRITELETQIDEIKRHYQEQDDG